VNGFSLIEVAIAIGILAVTIPTILGLVSISMGTQAESMDHTVQTEIARSISGEAFRSSFATLEDRFHDKQFFFTVEGMKQENRDDNTIFLAETSISDPPEMLTSDRNRAITFTVTITHLSRSRTNAVHSHLILNTGQ
jgi:uncharacterized protein (TIGR02598 family)